MLVNAIIDKLKTGSIKKIILFSDTEVFPDPPYVVVKPEVGVMEKTRSYRIIAHNKKGQFDALEEYTLKELDNLLLGGLTDDKGNRYKLYANGFTDITSNQIDDSYFMERIYIAPLLVR